MGGASGPPFFVALAGRHGRVALGNAMTAQMTARCSLPEYRPAFTCRLFVLLSLLLPLSSACRQAPDTNRPISVDEQAPVFRNVGGTAVFVGDDACFDCHESEYTGYQSHGMANSYYRLTRENRVEQTRNVTVRDPRSDLRYTVLETPDGLYQEEYLLDERGKKVHSLQRRMDFVVGSGTAARTYLTESNGRLFQLPLSWYTQKKAWDLSPGYEVANFRFDRLVPDRCMACHNSYPETVSYVEGKFRDVPEGIGCERCHGPGSIHVTERLEVPEPAAEIDDSIVNPVHLPFERRLDVCQQCHLHTTVSLLRERRDAFDFRPSEDLASHIALFAKTGPDTVDAVEVISHADRMKKSACFTATQTTTQPLECTTCHDPHEGFRQAGPDYFSSTCVQCHVVDQLAAEFSGTEFETAHASLTACADCHMPKVKVEDAPHSSFTDHWIRVVPNEGEPSPAPAPAVDGLEAYFARDRDTREGGVYRAMAQIVYGRQVNDPEEMRAGVDHLESFVKSDTTRREAVYLAGLGHSFLGQPERAIPWLERAVKMSPDDPNRLNALAQAYEATGRTDAVVGRLYRRALSVQPAASDIRINYGRYLQAGGRLDDAIEQYRQALAENPWQHVAQRNLGTALAAAGRTSEAEEAFQEAIALNPLYAEALGNLGSLLAVLGREDEAGVLFGRAVVVAPDDATALGNLGAYRLNRGDASAAIDLLQRAIHTDSTFVDALANLSLAYFRVDDYASALRTAKRAVELDPRNTLARQVLEATQ